METQQLCDCGMKHICADECDFAVLVQWENWHDEPEIQYCADYKEAEREYEQLMKGDYPFSLRHGRPRNVKLIAILSDGSPDSNGQEQ
jgi:hypothetical protein